MRRKLVILAAIATLGLSTGARPARAQTTYCTPGSLMVCAAFSASTAQVSGVWHLYLHVWNAFLTNGTQGLSHVITFAGIGSSWTGTSTLVSAAFNGSAVQWSNDPGPNSNVVGAQLDVGTDTQNGVTDGLVGCDQPIPPGKYQTCVAGGPELDLDFTTSTQFLLTDAVFGWHSQAISGTTCSLWGNSSGQSTASTATLTSCSGTVTPEPVSIVLLGTGLAGAGLIRRRRRAATAQS